MLVVEFAAQSRLWCRYVCPQAALLILAKLINPHRLRVGYHREKCICSKGPDPCREACSLSLNPKTLATFWETECNNCGDCVVTCKKLGQALTLGFGPLALRSGRPAEDGNRSQAPESLVRNEPGPGKGPSMVE